MFSSKPKGITLAYRGLSAKLEYGSFVFCGFSHDEEIDWGWASIPLSVLPLIPSPSSSSEECSLLPSRLGLRLISVRFRSDSGLDHLPSFDFLSCMNDQTKAMLDLDGVGLGCLEVLASTDRREERNPFPDMSAMAVLIFNPIEFHS